MNVPKSARDYLLHQETVSWSWWRWLSPSFLLTPSHLLGLSSPLPLTPALSVSLRQSGFGFCRVLVWEMWLSSSFWVSKRQLYWSTVRHIKPLGPGGLWKWKCLECSKMTWCYIALTFMVSTSMTRIISPWWHIKVFTFRMNKEQTWLQIKSSFMAKKFPCCCLLAVWVTFPASVPSVRQCPRTQQVLPPGSGLCPGFPCFSPSPFSSGSLQPNTKNTSLCVDELSPLSVLLSPFSVRIGWWSVLLAQI